MPHRIKRTRGGRICAIALAAAGVDFDDVTGQLEREGLAKFEQSWNELSHTIAAELHRNHPARQS